MAKFKPGQSGNPGGRPKLPDDIKEARKLNQIEFERVANTYLWQTPEEFHKALASKSTKMIDLMVARIIELAVEKGDHQRLEFLLARMIGKVKEQIDVTGRVPFVIRRRDGEEVLLGVKPEEEED